MGIYGMIAGQVGQMYYKRRALEQQAQANVETARQMILSMNYAFQSSEQSRHDAFEATIAELENMKLQGKRLEHQLSASVNEGLMGGGRTASLLKRSAQADTNRATQATKVNYEKRSNEIDLNKEATLLNFKNQIASIKQVKKPSLLETAMEFYNMYAGVKNYKAGLKDIQADAMMNENYKSRFVDTGWLNKPLISESLKKPYNTTFYRPPNTKPKLELDLSSLNPYFNLDKVNKANRFSKYFNFDANIGGVL